MVLACVTHGTESAEAQRLLRSFYARASRDLGSPVQGWTLDDVARKVRPGDRVFALFFTLGGHVRRDLLPVLASASATFCGTIPAPATSALVLELLAERRFPPGTPVLLVSPRSKVAPVGKAESMESIAALVRTKGFPTRSAYYDDPESLPRVAAGAPPPVAFLLVLLPGYTLGKAPEVLRAQGYEVLPGPWLPRLEPGLLAWMRSETAFA